MGKSDMENRLAAIDRNRGFERISSDLEEDVIIPDTSEILFMPRRSKPWINCRGGCNPLPRSIRKAAPRAVKPEDAPHPD